ncbi:MAG: precorrin-8X methylmutase [Oscillospiraceae bacterium]
MERGGGLEKARGSGGGKRPYRFWLRLHELMEEGRIAPALIIGVPVELRLNLWWLPRSSLPAWSGPRPYIVARGREGPAATCVSARLFYDAVLYQMK